MANGTTIVGLPARKAAPVVPAPPLCTVAAIRGKGLAAPRNPRTSRRTALMAGLNGIQTARSHSKWLRSRPPPPSHVGEEASKTPGYANVRIAGVRQEILEAAIGVLRTRGVSSLTQVNVAAAAGVRKSHLTYYFPTRTDLLKGIVQELEVAAERELEAAHRQERLTREDFHQMITARAARSEYAMLAASLIVLGGEEPKIKPWLTRMHRTMLATLHSNLVRIGVKPTPDSLNVFQATLFGAAALTLHLSAEEAMVRLPKVIGSAWKQLLRDAAVPDD